ncbi:glycosyl hydrolase [Xylariaceae sp. FL0255]|nr:glycosyl hydrolase [Xylariaceae sp. FL0255]
MSLTAFTLASALCLGQLTRADVDRSKYVNPFMGSEGPYEGLAFGGGDIFVGASMPFGMAKVGIDTYETNVSYSTINGGYTPKGLVTAVSMMHESGTGGGAKYGIVPQMPLTDVDAPVNILDNTTYWQNRTGDDTASVGYYATKLESGVGIELSGSHHTGIMQYSFPSGGKHILVDASHYLPQEGGSSDSQYYTGGEMALSDDGKNYTGFTSVGGGFSEGPPITVYFCGEFDQAPSEAKTFSARNTQPVKNVHVWADEPIPQATFNDGNQKVTSGPLSDRVGALFTWNTTAEATLKSRVGISFISTDKACAYIKDEIPSWTLNDTVNAAVDLWNQDVFSKVQIPLDGSQNLTNIRLMYSSLYFMHLMPSNRTGENPLWESSDSWDDFYTLWDIFRCTVSLYHLLQPEYYTSMIRGIIDIWKYDGYLPDGRSGNWNGLVQGGSNADNVLADAYVKGLTGVNWTEAYQAMLKDAEVTPYNEYSPTDMTNGIAQGRGALDDWLKLGYVSADLNTRALSRSVEYSLNDFSLSQVAKGVAPGDVEKYLNRSGNWQNTWGHNVTHKNFTGFLAPRNSTGQFNLANYNPALCGGCEWVDISYEGTPFEYSFTVPHDMETLIDFMGGDAEFERRLDYIFQPNSSEQSLSANGAGITTLMNIGNEPDFATPLEYHYIQKSYKSVQRTRELANEYFHDANYGVPGNSDAGALNSWLIWQMLGLYPVVTQPVYLLSSPWFSDVNMSVNGNSTLRISATNLDNSDSFYVQSVKVNGQNWTKNWLEHDDVMVKGGTIEFVLGKDPIVWETGDVPPSPGHVTLPRP